jgi:hypothetical protein
MRWCLPLIVMLGLAVPARAEAPLAPAKLDPLPVMLHLGYEAYVAGFNMMSIDAGLALRPDGYGLGMRTRTKGFIGAFVHGDSRTRVDGVFQGAGVAPSRFVSAGLWRGDARRTDIEYRAGQPVVRALIPADDEREPVPEALQRNTVDTLSAIIMLLHDVSQSGHCDSAATTFDGRRVTQVAARTVGIEVLASESRSSFQGQALHCQISGRQIAGFPHDAGPDDYVRRAQTADVWFAPVLPGQAPVPVLMSFETRFLGHMTVYLTAAVAGGDLSVYNPD